MDEYPITIDEVVAFYQQSSKHLPPRHADQAIKSLQEEYKPVIRNIKKRQSRGMGRKSFVSLIDYGIFTVAEDLNEILMRDHPTKKQCPLCGSFVKEIMMNKHLEEELFGTSQGIRVVIDRSFGITEREDRIAARNAMELKQKIYNKYRIPVSKQKVACNGKILTGKDPLTGTVVEVQLKRKDKFPSC